MKVLHMYTALNDGGVERLLLNYYSRMDRSDLRFDMIVPGEHKGILEQDFENLGSHIYHVPTMHQDYKKNFSMIYDIMKREKYDIVHCHGYRSCPGLIAAKKCGIKVRIIHSHLSYEEGGIFTKVIARLTKMACKVWATDRFACGIDAGKWMYGKREYEKGKFTVIHNAVELEKFAFNMEQREKLRKELGIENRLVIGNVARFSYQKNQEFLLETFAEVIKLREDAVLVFAGEGDSFEAMKKMAEQLNISDNVLFLGARKDVQNLLSAFDIFVLPSRFEGLPVSLVEVQASGLPGFVSDRVTEEVNVTGLLKYMSLDCPVKDWAEEIVKKSKDIHTEQRINVSMQGGNYDINAQAKRLQQLYRELLSKK